MCLATVLLFLLTVEVDWAAARGSLTLPRWLSVGGPDVSVIFSHRIAMSIQTQNVVARIVGDVEDALVGWEDHRGARAESGGKAPWADELAAFLSRCESAGSFTRRHRRRSSLERLASMSVCRRRTGSRRPMSSSSSSTS
jgi:hypothetical protein